LALVVVAGDPAKNQNRSNPRLRQRHNRDLGGEDDRQQRQREFEIVLSFKVRETGSPCLWNVKTCSN
jgi:hypothetical protein